MKCNSDKLTCYKYAPDVVQCYNRGFDGVDVQWECKSQLDENVKFGKLNVICEGYDYPDDSYILAGSCGVNIYFCSRNVQ